MDRFVNKVLRNSKTWVFLAAALVILASLLTYRLVTITSGGTTQEVLLYKRGITLSAIFNNPVDLPLHFFQWVSIGIFHSHNLLLVRLPDVIFGGMTVVLYSLLLYKWYGTRTMILGTVLFACSPWFLHIARITGIDAEQQLAVVIIIFLSSFINKDTKSWLFMVEAFILSVLLYVPGMIWFEIALFSLNRKYFRIGWSKLSSIYQKVGYILCWLVPLSLLFRYIFEHLSSWKIWLALPSTFASLRHILSRLGDGFSAFVWHAPVNPTLWLGRLPILDSFGIVMLIVGIIFYARHWQAIRTKSLLIFLMIGLVLFSLAGGITLSAAVPIVYAIAAAGVGYLLHEWLTVFPRNPLARFAGVIIVSAVVGFSCWFGLRQYFVAWPNNPMTKVSFQELG